jgi:ABC-2 type transport system permease protein
VSSGVLDAGLPSPSPDSEEVTLVEVPGPSALGGGWRRALELLYVIGVNDFKKTYFNTVLGYLWSLARPLMLFAVLLTVFTTIVRFQIPHYAVLLLMNIVLFGFFQEATVMAIGSVVAQEGVVRKTQFPRLVIPLSVVLTSFFNLVMNLIVVLAFLIGFGVTPRWTWLLFPVVLMLLIALTVPVAMIVSALYPRFRDVSIIWTVVSTALFYASPIFYTIQVVAVHHHTVSQILRVNPLTPILGLAREWMVGGYDPFTGSLLIGLLAPAVLLVVLWLMAVWIFNREAPRIAEQL